MQANSLRIAGTELGEHRHICALFNSRDESYRVLLPFVKDGFECGDRAFHVVDPALRDDHLHRLEDAAIPTESAQRTGQFRLGDWNEVYFPDGGFDQERMLAMLDAALNDAPEQPLLRLVCDMRWARRTVPAPTRCSSTKAASTPCCSRAGMWWCAATTWPSSAPA